MKSIPEDYTDTEENYTDFEEDYTDTEEWIPEESKKKSVQKKLKKEPL